MSNDALLLRPGELGVFIRDHRIDLGITTGELAERCSLSMGRINRIENGFAGDIGCQTLVRLAHGLRVSPLELVEVWMPEVDWRAPGGVIEDAPPLPLPPGVQGELIPREPRK